MRWSKGHEHVVTARGSDAGQPHRTAGSLDFVVAHRASRGGELIQLLPIEGLPKAVLTQILATAGTFLGVNDRDVEGFAGPRFECVQA